MTRWLCCGAVLLFSILGGCGAPRNETIIPESPEPLPPGGLKIEQIEDASGPPPIEVER
jgi:hypothetical protein